MKEYECRYNEVKHHTLALVFGVTKYGHYLYGRQFRVLTSYPCLYHVMNFPCPRSRIAKCVTLLSVFDFTVEEKQLAFQRLEQGLTGCVEVGGPTAEVTGMESLMDLMKAPPKKQAKVTEAAAVKGSSKPRGIWVKKGQEDASRTTCSLLFEEELPPPHWTLLFDGAAKHRERAAGIAFVLKDEMEQTKVREKRFVRPATSNEAEYRALILGLEVAHAHGIQALQVLGDSRLVNEQLLGPFACKAENLKPLHARAMDLLQGFPRIAIRHVRRAFNAEADALPSEALAKGLYGGQESDEVVNLMVTEAINQAMVEDPGPWYEQLWAVLLTNTHPAGATAKEKTRLKQQSVPFTIIDGVLYHMGPDKVMRRCMTADEILRILYKAHTSVCGGNHFDGRTTGLKISRAGYYWPTLFKDAREYCMRCDRCQRFSKVTLRRGELHPIRPTQPFGMWGIDCIGSLPQTCRGKEYIIVATDYVTRWAEAQAVASIGGATTASFLFRKVSSRFGIPHSLVSDQGQEFCNEAVRNLNDLFMVHHRLSTRRHQKKEAGAKFLPCWEGPYVLNTLHENGSATILDATSYAQLLHVSVRHLRRYYP